MNSRLIFFALLTVALSYNSPAQISTPSIGDIWIYDYSNVSACGPIHAVYEKDTTLAGKDAMVFKETLFNVCTHTEEEPIDTLDWGLNIIAIEDSLVWYWQNGKFDTLMDFGASVGDKWTYSNSVDSMFCEVEEVITDVNLGVGVSVVYTWSIDNDPQTYKDTIYELLLGGFGYIIPNDIYESALDGQEGGPLACFSNSQGRYSDGVWTAGGKACTDIIDKLDVSELSKTKEFRIYPNPSAGKIYLSSVTNELPKRVAILDSKGALVYEAESLEQLTNLVPQLYFVKIERQDGLVEVHKVLVD